MTVSQLQDGSGIRAPAMSRGDARRSLRLYFAILIVITVVMETLIITHESRQEALTSFHVLGLMWAPGVAAIITRLVRREGFADMGLAFGGWGTVRWILAIMGLILTLGFVTYGVAWWTGLAEFQQQPSTSFPDAKGVELFLLRVFNVPIGIGVALLTATGEELGWRGTMLNRMVDAGWPHPVLWSGVIWGLWHVPLILAGIYVAGSILWLSVLCFLLVTVLASIIMARIQWWTGTVWLACVFHAAWNQVIQGLFDRSTQMTPDAKIWVGESGVVLVAFLAIIAVFFWRGSWTMRRHPKDPEVALPCRP